MARRPFVQLLDRRPPADPPDLVANAIEQRLTEVGPKRAFPSRLEPLHVLKRLQHGFLHKVVGVGHVAGPAGETAARPAIEQRHVPAEEIVEGAASPAWARASSREVVSAAVLDSDRRDGRCRADMTGRAYMPRDGVTQGSASMARAEPGPYATP